MARNGAGEQGGSTRVRRARCWAAAMVAAGLLAAMPVVTFASGASASSGEPSPTLRGVLASPIECDPPGVAAFGGRPSFVTAGSVATLFLLKSGLGLDLGSVILFGPPPITSPSPPPYTWGGLKVTKEIFRGWPVYVYRSAQPSSRVIVAIHGGAWVAQPTVLHWLDYASIAKSTNATVVVPIYPLAPKGSASTVIPALTDFVSNLVAVHQPQNVAIYGDSAGGNIALAVAQEIHRRHAPQVARMVLLSPVVDASLSNTADEAIHDPVLDIRKLRPDALMWAGTLDVRDPLVSPLFGSFEGMPSTTVYSGSREIFAPDIVRLHATACAAHADFRFVLQQGALHDWPIAPNLIPEARAARPELLRELVGH